MSHKWLLSIALAVASLGASTARAQNNTGALPAGKASDGSQSSAVENDSAARLESIEVQSARKGTELEIRTSSPVSPTVTTIADPNRLVMDFPNTVSTSAASHISVERDGIKGVRIGVHPLHPPVTRVVVDLVRPRNYRVVSQGSKLILKLDESIAADYPAPANASWGDLPPVAQGDLRPVAQPETTEPSPDSSRTHEVLQAKAGPDPTGSASTPVSSNSVPAPESAAGAVANDDSSKAAAGEPDASKTPADVASIAPASPPAIAAASAVPRSAAGNKIAGGTAIPANSSSGVTTGPAPVPPPPASSEAQPANAQPTPATTGAGSARTDVQFPKPPASQAQVEPQSDQYIIGEQDVLAITVWKEPELSGVVVVRPDGKITVPLVNEVKVVGLTPAQLQALLTEKLKPFVNVPQVTVSVRQINSRNVYLIGEAAREGSFPINSSTTVLQLIAQAGGLKDFAKRKKIYIIRKLGGKQMRYSFNYDEVIRGNNPQQNIVLEPGDLVVVP